MMRYDLSEAEWRIVGRYFHRQNVGRRGWTTGGW